MAQFVQRLYLLAAKILSRITKQFNAMRENRLCQALLFVTEEENMYSVQRNSASIQYSPYKSKESSGVLS